MSAVARPRRNKKPKDPNAPKRALSAYFLFSKEHRPTIKAANPEAKTVGDVAKLLGQQWREMDESQKQPYHDEAAVLKAAYQVKVAEYLRSDQYAAHQATLKQFELDQQENNQSEVNKVVNQQKSKNKKKASAKQAASMSKQQIKQKINSFFDRYRGRLRASKRPRVAVSDQYGWGIEKASEWVAKRLEDNDSKAYGFHCVALFKANIEMMDFSMGGPHDDISQFMEHVDKWLSKLAVDDVRNAEIKNLYASLTTYHGIWDSYSLGDDVKPILDVMKEKFSF